MDEQIENPNEYDDDGFSRFSGDVDTSIQSLWEAGAKVSEIEDCIANAFANVEVNVAVSIIPANDDD